MPVAAQNGWTAVHAPAANTVATATKAAAGAGVKNICTAILATLTAGAIAPAAINVEVVLRDGAAGAGTIIWHARLSLPAVAGESAAPIALTDLWIEGSANTAMTLEFTAAGGANTFETVSLSGVAAQ